MIRLKVKFCESDSVRNIKQIYTPENTWDSHYFKLHLQMSNNGNVDRDHTCGDLE